MMPWQRHVVDVAFEYDPDAGDVVRNKQLGRQSYDEVDGTVMRQCGKTVGLLFPVMVNRCVMMPHRLGRQRATFTMQKRDNARRKLERDFAEILRATDQFVEVKNPKARPSRSTKQWKMGLNNGSEHVLFGQGNYLQIDTPSKQAGHGDTLDLGVQDEIRFYLDDRVEQAMRPAMSTRHDAQLWCWSTAGDEESFYLWAKVVAGRRSVEENRSARVCYFEWSIPAEADLWDPEVWWEYHPALGWTIDIDFIFTELDRAERNPDDGAMDTFRQEYANQWVRTPALNDGERILQIPLSVWESPSRKAPISAPRPAALGVVVSPGGRSTAITATFRNEYGLLQQQVLDHESGTFWVEKRLSERRDEWSALAIGFDDFGETKAMAPDIGRAAGIVPVMPFAGTKYSAACEAFRLNFVEEPPRACHADQATLNSAIEGATKKMRGAEWLWDPHTSLADIAPLCAATVSTRALETLPEPEPVSEPSIYVWQGGVKT